jgi:hypothetical protein
MALRNYTNTAQPTSLAAGINDSVGTFAVDDASGFPTHPFTIAVDRGTPSEEAMLVTNVSGNTFTVTRGWDPESPTTPSAHLLGASVEHTVVALDFIEANAHIEDEDRDDHPQYLNEDRAALWLPTTVTGGSITAIGSMDSTYRTHRQLTIGSVAYERRAILFATLPFALVADDEPVQSQIVRSGVTYSHIDTNGGRSGGTAVLSHTHISRWATIPANESWTFTLQARYGSATSGGATSATAALNTFEALVVRSL